MAIAIALIYVAVLLLAWLFQTNLIFFPAKLSSNHEFRKDVSVEEVNMDTPDGEKINGLFFQSNSKRVILYFHGNAGCLDSWQYVWDDVSGKGFNLFIIDYRGFGKSTGNISEKGFYTDAQTAYDYLLRRGFLADSIVV